MVSSPPCECVFLILGLGEVLSQNEDESSSVRIIVVRYHHAAMIPIPLNIDVEVAFVCFETGLVATVTIIYVGL